MYRFPPGFDPDPGLDPGRRTGLLLLIISRIVKKRKDKKNFFLMLLTLVLATALFICVIVGVRGGGEGTHAIPPEPPADMEETEVSSSSEIIPLGDGEIPPSWQE